MTYKVFQLQGSQLVFIAEFKTREDAIRQAKSGTNMTVLEFFD